LPDVRDGLTRIERVILRELQRAQAELHGRNVPSMLLYGRVLEQVEVSREEFTHLLSRLVSRAR
jgi:hypothetical protein